MRKRGRHFLLSLTVTAGLLVTSRAGGGEKSQMPFVAVFDMEGRGSSLTPMALMNLTEYLPAKLVECGYKVSAADQSRTWTGVMFAGFGGGCALIITGVILWVLSPGDREWFEAHSEGISVAPVIDGTSFALQGRW